VAPWLAWSGTFDAAGFDGGTADAGLADGGGADRSATLVFVAGEHSTDPWFVRADGYPGVGQSLAWDTPVIAEPGSAVRRRVTVFIADGILAASDIEALINNQGEKR
jgi:hypothetical protein